MSLTGQAARTPGDAPNRSRKLDTIMAGDDLSRRSLCDHFESER